MSFTGDLEHLPIVDVIQLLHATRKSGVLSVMSRKGESQLVFKDGYIVSANHLNSTIRLGEILISLNVITPETLEQTLQQQQASDDRKPLIVMLLEMGLVKEEEAYKGLELLIELTIVEMLTWKRGSFCLDVKDPSTPDDYRYYPGKLGMEVNIDTQTLLMDALRIYDEKMRDGELTDESLDDDLPMSTDLSGGADSLLSADDLGLGNLDKLERRIPAVFASLDDRTSESGSEEDMPAETASPLGQHEGEELLAFLDKPVRFWAEAAPSGGPIPSVILFTADEILSYCITTVCKQEGIPVFASSDEQDLEHIVDQFLSKQRTPLLVIDRPGKQDGLPEEKVISLRQQLRKQFPGIAIIQLAPPLDYPFTIHAYKDGIRAVIPSPSLKERRSSFVPDMKSFLEALLEFLCGFVPSPADHLVGRLRTSVSALRGMKEAPDIAFALLQFIADSFERSITLIVRNDELIAEKSFGIKGEKERGAAPSLGLRIPLAPSSLLRTITEEGSFHFGETTDAVIREQLFPAIGAPAHSTVLLLPLRSFGKTIAIVYGDFGRNEVPDVPVDMLEVLANYAGRALEYAVARKKRETPAP